MHMDTLGMHGVSIFHPAAKTVFVICVLLPRIPAATILLAERYLWSVGH